MNETNYKLNTIAHVSGGLLGLLFITFGMNFFFSFIPMPSGPPEGSPPALFMAVLFPTGYLAFVKVLEIIGGLTVAVERIEPFTNKQKITESV